MYQLIKNLNLKLLTMNFEKINIKKGIFSWIDKWKNNLNLINKLNSNLNQKNNKSGNITKNSQFLWFNNNRKKLNKNNNKI